MRTRVVLGLVLLMAVSPAFSARIADIKNTNHNFSITGPGTVKATSETRICIFCHTPHGAETIAQAPLWNRSVAGAVYTYYDSSSMDATDNGQPTQGSSRLCLSCHDGTMAIGAVNVKDGSYTDKDPATADIAMTGTGAGGVIPSGTGLTTGDTRNLGINLSNDHPISFTYDSALATADGDLYDPATAVHVGNRSAGVKPAIPLDNGKVECSSCHDPHIRDTVDSNIKFLRLNRFQTNAGPTEGAFSQANDIICLGCHDKEGWQDSAHANSSVANEIYSATAAARFDFPNALPVWRAACLNCHDTHTVQGARRLLREGTDSVATPKAGGNPTLEETCFQCHQATASSILLSNTGGAPTEVPNIKSDFALPRNMPIASTEQPAGTEVHDIGTGSGSQRGKDFIESPQNLGKGNLNNRHVECTDCHNPHRVIKNDRFNDDPATPETAGTHFHPTNNTSGAHSNLASGVLRGSWGVEPVYGATEFTTNPSSYTVKKGVPPVNGPTDVGQSYVTREYQVCLKCHSDYAYDTPPSLGSFTSGTPSGTNGLTQYTNQAMEFQAPVSHQGEGTKAGTGANAAYATNNHRSWHPVMGETGRNKATRDITSTAVFKAPWDAGVGTQTMYCTDCHGVDNTGAISHPDAGDNFGPHGSENNFMLRGPWSSNTGTGTTEDICFKCHDYYTYATGDYKDTSGRTGYGNSSRPNLHGYHADKVGAMRCTWCHVAVPHGWKNKALLVNLLDVGPEVGLASGTVISDASIPYTRAPYYLRAVNKIASFAVSGNWQEANCVSKDWMKGVCSNPP